MIDKILFHTNPYNIGDPTREELSVFTGITQGLADQALISLPYEKGVGEVDVVLSFKTAKPLRSYNLDKHINKDTKKVYYYPDIGNEPKQWLIDILVDYDILLVKSLGTIDQWQEVLPDIEVYHWRQGVNPSFHSPTMPYNPKNAKWNWNFCGSMYNGREEFGKVLCDSPKGAIFGNDWDEEKHLNWKKIDIYNQSHALQVVRSIFSLDYNSYSIFDESYSVRVYKIMCAGGVLLANKQEGLDYVFTKGDHYMEYDNLKEMKDWISDPLEYFEADDLIRIGKQAREEVLAKHTYVHRGKELCEILKC